MINVDDVTLLVIPKDYPQIPNANPMVTRPFSSHVYNARISSNILRQM